jgi:hypothetical protein
MVQNEGFFDIGYFTKKKLLGKLWAVADFFSPSLETTKSTLYVFSISKASNEVKYKVYNFGLYEVPVLNNHFFFVYIVTPNSLATLMLPPSSFCAPCFRE